MRSIIGKAASRRSNRGASQLAEFAPALYVLFIIILMPMLDLATTFVAGATQYLATQDFAAKAATQPDFSTALNSMANEAYQFQGNGLAQFVHMAPVGGYTGCGDDMYLLSTNIASGAVTSSAADQPLTLPINTKTSMYELSVCSQYSVSPLVSLASVPLLGEIPGLGKPTVFVFSANRPVEHPGGLQWSTANGGNANPGGGTLTPFPRLATNPGAPSTATSLTWRTPNIFTDIQQAGQTVVSVNVINVLANYGPVLGNQNGGWVSTGLSVQPGQKVWLDTQAVGLWNDAILTTDANGLPPGTANPYGIEGTIDGNLPNGMLIGYTGSPPMFPYGHKTNGITGDPKFIPSGNTLLNFPINFNGLVSLACNDNQTGDTGSQMVRVIVTQ